MVLVDTHAHLDDSRFNADRAECIKRARSGSVKGIINVGIDRRRSKTSVQLAQQYDDMWAAVGVHPHAASHYLDSDFVWLKDLLDAHKEVVAVGEIGLDYYHNYSQPAQQRQVFRSLLKLAVKKDYPVVVHCREADEDCYAILKDLAPADYPVLMHCFPGDIPMMRDAVERGYFLALGGVVTFSNAKKTHEVALEVPLDRLVLETDCPYLSPHPQRGRRNEPAYLQHVARRIARLRDENIETIAERTTENAEKFFNIEVGERTSNEL